VVGTQLRGRDRDIEALTDFLRDSGPGLVLTGPAGVGKTKLAREATRLAGDLDVAVVWVQASASSHEIPFGAMAPYLPAIDTTLEMLPMLMHAAAALRALAGDRKLLLVLDDAPLIDNASALLMSQLVAAGDASVLVTQRSGAALPEPIEGLRLPRRELAALDLEATTAIAEDLAGGAVADLLVTLAIPTTLPPERLLRVAGWCAAAPAVVAAALFATGSPVLGAVAFVVSAISLSAIAPASADRQRGHSSI